MEIIKLICIEKQDVTVKGRWLPKVCSLDHGNKARVLEFLETVTYLSDLNDYGTHWSFLATANITHAHYLLFLKYVMVAKWWVFPAMNFTLFDMKPNKQVNKLKQRISGCIEFSSFSFTKSTWRLIKNHLLRFGIWRKFNAFSLFLHPAICILKVCTSIGYRWNSMWLVKVAFIL